MKALLIVLIVIGVSELCLAQEVKSKNVVSGSIGTAKIEATQNSQGQLVFQRYDLKGNATMLSSEDGLKALKEIARAACIASPSSITVSAGLISLTWEKSEICNQVK